MNREKFIKLSGWALILGLILFFIGAWAKSRSPYVPYAMTSLPIDRYAVPAGTPLIVIGLAMMSLGMIGLLVRYTPRLNNASALLGLGAISGLISAVGAALLGINDSSPGWDLFILGLIGQYLALVGLILGAAVPGRVAVGTVTGVNFKPLPTGSGAGTTSVGRS